VSLPPEAGNIRAPGIPKGTLTIAVSWAQVSAVADLDEEFENVALLKTGIHGLVSTRLDAFGYLTGWGLDAEITSCLDPAGRLTVFGVGIDGLGGREEERPLTLADLHELRKNLALRIALADFRLAIRYPGDMYQFAYRAAESIRQHFTEEGDTDRRASWLRRWDALRIDPSWIAQIKDRATARRHGDAAVFFVSGEEQVRVLETARRVIDRFGMFLRDPASLASVPVLRPPPDNSNP
jgi:hypothetical protein